MRKHAMTLAGAVATAIAIGLSSPAQASIQCRCEPNSFAATYEHGGALAMWLGQAADAWIYPGWFTMGGQNTNECQSDCAAWARSYWANQVCSQIGYDGEWIVQYHSWTLSGGYTDRYGDLQGDCHAL